jgi:hypothetical protein
VPQVIVPIFPRLDPIVGLAVAAVAVKEGIDAWRGEGCDCAAVPIPGQAACGCGPGCTDSRLSA